MQQKISYQLDRMDNKLQQLLEALRPYSDETLNQRPAAGQWSVLQVMHHLLLTETLSLRYVQKKLSFQPKLKPVNIVTTLRGAALRFYNLLPIKLKAPNNVGDPSLPEQSSLGEVARDWQGLRNDLRDYLQTLPEDIFRKEVYRHPLSGRQSLGGMIDFFDGHFDRHHKQIRRILRNLPKD
ncbi:MAG TPA: DinB family protein [Saprospiraceae bacterium]|nr:DinB family protein [Saprospiraceae bacterium]HMP25072.1 DinB family protein [Saprospiraceae bacterium]